MSGSRCGGHDGDAEELHSHRWNSFRLGSRTAIRSHCEYNSNNWLIEEDRSTDKRPLSLVHIVELLISRDCDDEVPVY